MERKRIARNEKKAKEENRVIIYADEGGVNLLPSVQKTYSEKGKTPILIDACKYTHLSVASGISEDGDIIYQVRQNSFNGLAMVLFLKEITKQVKKKVLIIWDGAKIHTCEAVKKFLTEQKSDKIWLVKTPPYSPELNADELVWNYLKNVELKNVCCKGILELRARTIIGLESIKSKKEIVKSFFKHPKVGFY